jgi:hypothetical protein
MKKNSQLTMIVLYQNLGFLGIMILCYLDELLKLNSLVFWENPFAYLFRRSTLEILLVLTVWFLVSTSTRRILDRIRYLEKFMRVCAWCRQINFQGEWIPLEEFMQRSFDTPTTHGICKVCLAKQQEAVERANAARRVAEKTAGAKTGPV